MAQVPRVYVDYIGNASRTIFDFDFPYQNESEVFVTVDGVITPYSWPAGSTASVQVLPAPPLGAKIRVYRSTMAYNPLHVFAAGVPFLPRYVDENNRQLIYVVQEAVGDTAAKAEAALEAATRAEAKVDAAIIDSSAKLRADLAAGTGANEVGYGASNVGATLDELSAAIRQTSRPPSFRRFAAATGGLVALKNALGDPLFQYLGIVFAGDSITWGTGTGQSSTPNPRDGTLSDARDNFASESYVNNFKRYVGSDYMEGATPVLSNFPASPTGQSIATYSRLNMLFPSGGRFTYAFSGAGASESVLYTPASITGAQRRLLDANTLGTTTMSVSFPFTGKSFIVSFAVELTTGLDYEVLLNGVSQGVYTTTTGEDGLTTGNDRRRTHTFPFVRNATVTLRTKRRSTQTVGGVSFRLEGILVNKVIKLSNQGINGSSSVSYLANNMAGNGSGDGVAIQADDSFVFWQTGTNDRITSGTRAKGTNTFRANLTSLVNATPAGVEQILMAANPSGNEDPAVYNITQGDIRNTVRQVAQEKGFDFIDNYAVYRGMPNSSYTADTLHPNIFGYRLMSDNIIGALEAS